MKKYLLCLGKAVLLYAHINGQYYFYDATHLEPEWRWEAGISVGLMNCLTDLGGHKGNGRKFIKDVNWKNTQACGGFFIETAHHDLFALRLESTWGNINACDSILKNDFTSASLRYQRNLHFRSRIFELSALIEFHPLSIFQADLPLISPFIITGIGYFHFQPEAQLDGNWIKLHPLRTEGEGFKEFPTIPEYKLNQPNFPLGLGLHYDAPGFAILKLEFIYRILATDYLDDVSGNYIDPSFFHKYFSTSKAELAQRLANRSGERNPLERASPADIRGNSKNKDAYFSFNLSMAIVLNRKRL